MRRAAGRGVAIAAVMMLVTCAAWAGAPATQARAAKHERMLYTAVRVRTATAGGSGTIVYSEPDKNGIHESYVLTNWHVVSSAISLVDRWSSLMGKTTKVEELKTVTVEIFRYADLSRVVGREAVDADIEAYSEAEDLALLRLRSEHKLPHVATLLPAGKKVYVYDRVYAVGCSLGHDPISTCGELASLNDEIENRSYWMVTSNIIFGNSGGACFLADTHEMIGIPSRVSAIGWSSPVTHMGYAIPMPRIRKWLASELLHFVVDPKFTPAQCRKLRAEKRRPAEKRGAK